MRTGGWLFLGGSGAPVWVARRRVPTLCAAALLALLSFLLGWVARGSKCSCGAQVSVPSAPRNAYLPEQSERVLQSSSENPTGDPVTGSPGSFSQPPHPTSTAAADSTQGLGSTALSGTTDILDRFSDGRGSSTPPVLRAITVSTADLGSTAAPSIAGRLPQPESSAPSLQAPPAWPLPLPPSTVVGHHEGDADAAWRPSSNTDGASLSSAPHAAEWSPVLPPSPWVGHEKDAEAVRRLRSLIQPLAKDNTILIVPSNLAFLPLALNLRCRLSSLGVQNILFWALDEQAESRLTSQGVPNFYDPTLTPEGNPNATWYRDGGYQRMMHSRPRAWWRVLATGFDMLFVDADIVAFRGPESWFPRVGDVEVQLDGFEGWKTMLNESLAPHLCAGLFWMRSGPRTLQLMESVNAELTSCLQDAEELKAEALRAAGGKGTLPTVGLPKGKRAMRCDDQLALSQVLHKMMRQGTAAANRGPLARNNLVSCWKQQQQTSLRVLMQDARVLLPGHLARRGFLRGKGFRAKFYYKRFSRDKQIRIKPALLHYNGFGHIHKKVASMKKFGWWELDSLDKCRV